jgi:hypothetical protein
MNGLALWAKGIEDVWPAIIVLIAIISAVIRWLGQLQGPAKSAPKARPMQPPAQPRPRPTNVEEEISEFLRRAAKGRGQTAPPPSKPREAPVPAEVIDDRPVGAAVPEQVRKYLDTQTFERRAAQLGSEVAQADDQVQSRLRSVFDHDVSRLAKRPGETSAAPTAQVAAAAMSAPMVAAAATTPFAALLGNIESLRQAIILNEILRRPEERWV